MDHLTRPISDKISASLTERCSLTSVPNEDPLASQCFWPLGSHARLEKLLQHLLHSSPCWRILFNENGLAHRSKRVKVMCLANSLITTFLKRQTHWDWDRTGEPAPQAALEMGLAVVALSSWPPSRVGAPLSFNLIRNFTLQLPEVQDQRVLLLSLFRQQEQKMAFHSLGKWKGSGNTGSPWLRDGPIQQSAGHRLRPSLWGFH